MLWLMRYSHSNFPNWGIAIILLTILVKLLTLPLTIKQYRSMAAMKKLGPQLKKIQEKHKEDKVRLQQEMMKLYRENQVNPLSGCLPMIMMMPVYFALYRTIYSAVELYQADFALWITDLSEQDPYYISPFILGLLMIIQMRLNPRLGTKLNKDPHVGHAHHVHWNDAIPAERIGSIHPGEFARHRPTVVHVSGCRCTRYGFIRFNIRWFWVWIWFWVWRNHPSATQET